MSKTHWAGPHLASDRAFGGAASEMHINATAGEGDMVTVFDDFNGVVLAEGFGDAANWETNGWVLTDDPVGAPTGDQISMNDPNVSTQTLPFDSCIRVFGGTVNDRGGNMQLDAVNGTVAAATNNHEFTHLWIPETATLPAGLALDNTIWTFGCRVGLRADLTTTGAGNWNSKLFIGWAAAGDTSIMDHDTGAITTTAGNLHGFHVPEDGSIDGISKRITADAMVDGTNFTELVAAGGADGTTANGAAVAGDTMWFDLALRMTITDMDDNAANGATEFFTRRIAPLATAPGHPGSRMNSWVRNPTVLSNETPNHSVALVPTIEFINGPTADQDGVVFVDWWTFGCSRISRQSK